MLTDLPLELLPQLLAPLVNRRDLYNVSLVCREWRDIGQRLLYRRIRLFGKDLSITRMLFETLADTPRLAKMVRNLEVRVYPLSLILKERLETEQLAIRMLKNCVNSEELVWTRKGSLTDGVFEAITSLPYLRSFELNAHTNLSPGSWDADHFLRLRPLRSLSLILPDRNVASMLPSFFEQQTKLASHSTAGTDGGERLLLEELSVLCRESTVINDKVVASLVPALSGGHLRSLALAGCAKLTATPLLDLLPHLPNLRNLALEACNIDPSFFLLAAPSLTQLHSLKLTHPGPHHPTLSAFFPSLETLLSQTTSLTAFTLYHSGASSSGSREWPRLPEHFVHRLTATVGPRLRKFEVSGILVSVDSIEMLAGGAQELRNLVLHLEQEFELPRLVAAFVPLSSLRTLHLLSQRADVSPDDVLELAEQCSPTLRQVGFRNRVWVVKRSFSPSLDSQEDAPRLPKIRFLETAAAFGAFRRNRYGAESDVETEVEEGSDSDGEESSGSEGVVGGHSE